MNELEEMRIMLIGARSQVEAALQTVNGLIERTREPEPEPEREYPRTFGGKPTPKENKDG